MTHTFRKNGERFVCDTGSGTVSTVSALQYKMLTYIKPPLTPDLPTSLRYDLAKYDGGAVEDAYTGLYALYEAGKLFSDGENTSCGDCPYADACGAAK